MTTIKRALEPINVYGTLEYGGLVEQPLKRLVPNLALRVECPVDTTAETCAEDCPYGWREIHGAPSPECILCRGTGHWTRDCAWEGAPVIDTIVHLNDHHEWTFEQLADWLDGLDVDLRVQRPEVPESLRPKDGGRCGDEECEDCYPEPGEYDDPANPFD